MTNVRKWKVRLKIVEPDNVHERQACGRVAQTIVALVAAKAKGITAAEMSCWAYRLGAYVHILRHDYGLDIVTLREEHDGGFHGRYVLITPVEIIEPDKT